MNRFKRKQDHIQHALSSRVTGNHGFDDIKFVHQALPELSMNDISLATTLGELKLSSPIIINAMTGGGGQKTLDINRKLAIVAREKGLAMAVGSQMAAVRDLEQAYTYAVVREEHPQGVIFANLGAEATLEQAQQAIDMLGANALQIHLNVIQELVMPEGDRDFTGLLHHIKQLVDHLTVPVIIKEVGFGMSAESARKLESIGVQFVDVGGSGGTNFALIENQRREVAYEVFNEWGMSTVTSLLEVKQESCLSAIASGGIHSPHEIVKALSLQANAVGMAGFFLKQIDQHSMEHVLHIVDIYHEQIKMMMCALGAAQIEDLQRVPLVLSGPSYHWLSCRGFDVHSYSKRRL